MAGKFVKATQAAITAATTAGYLTVGAAASLKFYEQAFVWVNAGGQTNVMGQITAIDTTAGTLGVKLVNHPGDPVGGESKNYGRSDLSAYNGGTVYMDDQLIYNRGENPVT